MKVLRSLALLALVYFGRVSPLLAQAEAETADLIFSGGDIVTMANAPREAQALAVKDGKILAVGSLAGVEKFKGPKTQEIDLKGKTLMPGFIEAHGHPFDSALGQFFADDIRPFTVKNADQVDAAVRAAVTRAKPGDYVFLNGLDPLLQKDVTIPSQQQLNAWAPKNPLIIVSNSGHAAYGNSLAFQKAGITDQTPDLPGSHYQHGPDGKLNGTENEVPAITALTQPLLATLDGPRSVALLARYYEYLTSKGITAVSNMSFRSDFLPIYQSPARPCPIVEICQHSFGSRHFL